LRKQFKVGKIKNGARILAYMLRTSRRFMGGGPGTMAQQNLMRAVNYMKLSTGAIIGWGSKSSPYWGNAVQEGKQGTPYRMEHTVIQPITSKKQEKFLRAIGMMPKDREIEQPKAAFFAPFIRGRAGWINATMDREIEKRIKQEERKVAKIA
jgi:hypothetical protein